MRHFLTLKDFTKAEILEIINLGLQIKKELKKAKEKARKKKKEAEQAQKELDAARGKKETDQNDVRELRGEGC